MPYPELVAALEAQGMCDAEVQHFKTIRRRVKNRKSARKCSRRKRARYMEMDEVNQDLSGRRHQLERGLRSIQEENLALRAENIARQAEQHRLSMANRELVRQAQALQTQLAYFKMLHSGGNPAMAA